MHRRRETAMTGPGPNTLVKMPVSYDIKTTSLREFDTVVLLRDHVSIWNDVRDPEKPRQERRHYPAGSMGTIVDLVEGRSHCDVAFAEDVACVALVDLKPA